MRRAAALAVLLALAGCGGQELRFSVLPPAVEPTIAPARVGTRSLEVREATLPLYAELEQIYVEAAPGVLISDTDILWAETPAQAVTQGLVSALARTTTARVAAEPWPFESFPDARLEVRIDELLAQSTGLFVMAGIYYVASSEENGREVQRPFRIEVPANPSSPAEIARAKSLAIARLARQVASDL